MGYNADMHSSEGRGYLPGADRLSVVTATILLVYTLGRFIDLPGRELAVQLPGIFLAVEVRAQTFIALLVACLTAAGTDWLLRDHPAIGEKTTLEHWLLPAFTAWVIGIPLFQLPDSYFSPVWQFSYSFAVCLTA